MEYKTCLTFVFILGVVSCEKCVDNDSDTSLISDFEGCQAKHRWIFNQASPSIDDRRNISNIFTPSARPICIASNTLSLVSGGVLEAVVNSQSITHEDYITVLVFGGEDNNVVGQATLIEKENGFHDGRHVLKVTLGGVGNYDGFIMVISNASFNFDTMVESLCLHHSHTQQQEKISENTLPTPHYVAPDIYALQTGSILKYTVHPNENEENIDTTATLPRISKVEVQVLPSLSHSAIRVTGMHVLRTSTFEVRGSAAVTVQNQSFWVFDREDFWTPLTISLTVVIPVIFLALLCWACFALGKCQGAKQDPQMMYEDFDNLPKPYLVPRVKSVYSESVAGGSTYGGGNSNIYSV